MALNLSYIHTKNTLQLAEQKSSVSLAIVNKVKELDGFERLKHDTELCCFICRCLENSIECRKVDKKRLAFEVYDKLFEMSGDDKQIISTLIDFLCANKLIKKMNTLKKWSRLTSDFFARIL